MWKTLTGYLPSIKKKQNKLECYSWTVLWEPIFLRLWIAWHRIGLSPDRIVSVGNTGIRLIMWIPKKYFGPEYGTELPGDMSFGQLIVKRM
jgi:hypothetical protein